MVLWPAVPNRTKSASPDAHHSMQQPSEFDIGPRNSRARKLRITQGFVPCYSTPSPSCHCSMGAPKRALARAPAKAPALAPKPAIKKAAAVPPSKAPAMGPRTAKQAARAAGAAPGPAEAAVKPAAKPAAPAAKVRVSRSPGKCRSWGSPPCC